MVPQLTRLKSAGADTLFQQYIKAREAAKDPVVEYRQAEWSWMSGRRKSACQRLEAFARGVENGPLREIASRAYSQLAVWSLAMGDRTAAAQLAQKGALVAGPASAGAAMVARMRSCSSWKKAARVCSRSSTPMMRPL